MIRIIRYAILRSILQTDGVVSQGSPVARSAREPPLFAEGSGEGWGEEIDCCTAPQSTCEYELTPVSAESTPVSAESTPVSAELTPVSAESTPVSAELTPVSAESTPVSAESTSVSAELTPVSAELTPVSAVWHCY